MRLMQGRIGEQEGASLIGMSMFMSMVFTIDSEYAYTGGNSTYISVPLSALIALGVFLFALAAMKKSGSRSLPELCDYAFGRAGGQLCRVVLIAFLIANAYMLVSHFMLMIHSYVFPNVRYELLTVWVIPAVAFMAFKWFECIARTAKCIALFLGLLMVLSVVSAASGYSVYRLYPFIGNGLISTASDSLTETVRSMAAPSAMLCFVNGMQGYSSTKRSGVTAVISAAALACIVQLAIGLAYTYSELEYIPAPVYGINMVTLDESYIRRHDNVVLMMWLGGCIVAAAFYIYASARLYSGMWAMGDVRPSCAGLSLLVAAMVIARCDDFVGTTDGISVFIDRWGFIAGLAPVLLSSVAALIKLRLERRKSNAEKA